ncbi:MAG: hypothetical protein JO130_00720 [Solirubrobacterales bacterium]|nr:hypothetical protein [Solirubrobacterales bacterium]
MSVHDHGAAGTNVQPSGFSVDVLELMRRIRDHLDPDLDRRPVRRRINQLSRRDLDPVDAQAVGPTDAYGQWGFL